ncbi:MAG: hypothetical protein CMJ05_03565 [Pelagibacterales bacterium]|nr:hypothetical protein [Pelagibacterales bacterium]|tara:strand:+ start:3720 stop:4799 length:1080 start_codon:yes stop_codon:yes gene_type:complete
MSPSGIKTYFKMNNFFEFEELFFNNKDENNFNFSQKKKENWDDFLNQQNNVPVFYSHYFNVFQNEILKGKNSDIKDLSFEILWNNKLIGIFPITLIKGTDNIGIPGVFGHLLPVLYEENLPLSIISQIDSLLIKKLIQFSENLGNIKLSFLDQITPKFSLTNWHKLLLKNSFNCNIQRESFVDLSWDYSEIKKNYRKSHKSRISQGERLWNLIKLTENHERIWNEFKSLHYKSAGRKTRSDKSWDILYESLINNCSSFYYCTNENEEMIGGALIMLTSTEAFYAIGANDRSLFKLPIGHALQDFIIKDLKNSSSIKWYRLGRFYNSNDFIKPTEKEITIGSFKNGFATHLITNFIFNRN